MKSIFNSLDIGMKIKIIKLDDKEKINYSSQVLDILDQDTIVVSGPLKRKNLVFIHKGDRLKIIYNVKDKGFHSFKTEVLSKNYFSLYSLKLRRTSDIEKIQMRNYYRLSTRLNLDKEHYVIKDNKSLLIKERCQIKDISGGGMQLYCNHKHNIQDQILCSMKIGISPINFTATIIRINEVDSFNYKYSLGISFLDIEEVVRDQIIKYIFEQQRILRLKGLI